MVSILYREFYTELLQVGIPKIFDNYPLSSSILGKGMGREVRIVKGLPLVCKIATNELGLLQNKTEFAIWQKYMDKHLASVVYYDSQYLIMERVQPLKFSSIYSTINEIIDSPRISQLIATLVEKHNLEHLDVLKTSSWGISEEGIYKCFDYGLLVEHRSMAGR